MNTLLWIVTGLLAAVFAATGLAKIVLPRDRLVDRMSWVQDRTDAQVKAIGALEVAGAVGLVLPAILGIAPVLVPLAAIGLALTMAGAVATHLRSGDGLAGAAPAVVLGLLCLFVAYGRLGPAPF